MSWNRGSYIHFHSTKCHNHTHSHPKTGKTQSVKPKSDQSLNYTYMVSGIATALIQRYQRSSPWSSMHTLSWPALNLLQVHWRILQLKLGHNHALPSWWGIQMTINRKKLKDSHQQPHADNRILPYAMLLYHKWYHNHYSKTIATSINPTL